MPDREQPEVPHEAPAGAEPPLGPAFQVPGDPAPPAQAGQPQPPGWSVPPGSAGYPPAPPAPPGGGWPPQPVAPEPRPSGPPIGALLIVGLTLLAATLAGAFIVRTLSATSGDERANTGSEASTASGPHGRGYAAGSVAAVPVDVRQRRKAGMLIVTGRRDQRGTMTLIVPAEIGRASMLPVRIKGKSLPAPAQSGSSKPLVILSHAPCPARLGEDQLLTPPDGHRGPFFEVYADDVFQGAGRILLREVVADRINICGYFIEHSGKPPTAVPELVVATKLKITPEPLGKAPPNARILLPPGVYEASGRRVRGGGPDAAVEFEITKQPGEVTPSVKDLAFAGLKPGRCTQDGAPRPDHMLVTFTDSMVTDTIMMTQSDKRVGISGGTDDGRHFRGQIFIDHGECTSVVRFVASRRNDRERPLRDRVR